MMFLCFPLKSQKSLVIFVAQKGWSKLGHPWWYLDGFPIQNDHLLMPSGKFCGHRCPVHLWLGNSATYISYHPFTIYFLGSKHPFTIIYHNLPSIYYPFTINRGPKHRPQPGGPLPRASAKALAPSSPNLLRPGFPRCSP